MPRFRFLFVLACLAAFLAAPALTQATPTPGGTAIAVLGSDPEHLNAAISTGYPVGAVGASLYSALVAIGADGAPYGELAESWTVSDDNLVYTFALLPATFHDGVPVTAEDVVYTMTDILAPNHGRFQRAFNEMESVAAADPATVASPSTARTHRC